MIDSQTQQKKKEEDKQKKIKLIKPWLLNPHVCMPNRRSIISSRLFLSASIFSSTSLFRLSLMLSLEQLSLCSFCSFFRLWMLVSCTFRGTSYSETCIDRLRLTPFRFTCSGLRTVYPKRPTRSVLQAMLLWWFSNAFTGLELVCLSSDFSKRSLSLSDWLHSRSK